MADILLTEEEIMAIPVTNRGGCEDDLNIARAQIKKIVEWGNEPCPHGTKCADTSTASRFECSLCWQELEEMAKK